MGWHRRVYRPELSDCMLEGLPARFLRHTWSIDVFVNCRKIHRNENGPLVGISLAAVSDAQAQPSVNGNGDGYGFSGCATFACRIPRFSRFGHRPLRTPSTQTYMSL